MNGNRTASHYDIAATYSDALLEAIIADLGKRNLSDQQDHETRFLAKRLSACRRERRERKQSGKSSPAAKAA